MLVKEKRFGPKLLFLLTILAILITNYGIAFVFYHSYNPQIIRSRKSSTNFLPDICSEVSSYCLDWNIKIGDSYDENTRSVATDSCDNIYIVGWQDITGSANNRDIILTKFTYTGQQVWIKTWGGSEDDIGYDLVIDSSDNIYIIGLTKSRGDVDGDVVIIKYNTAGIEQWNFTWGGSNFDCATGIDIDELNNFYITGWTMSFGDSDGDVFLIKFNNTWDQQWVKYWGGSNKEEAADVLIDLNNTIYISGRTDSIGNGGDAFILKYNSSGGLQWERTWGTYYAQMASSIAVDSSHNIYAVGMSFGHPASSGKGILIKYDSEGNFQWEEIWGYNGVFNNYFYEIIIDSNDELFITGITRSLGIAGNDDAIFFNYDILGNQQWYKIWSESDKENLFGICKDTKNNIYTVGGTASSTAGGSDILFLKYSFKPQITINFPNENDVFRGTAPDFVISILGSYENIWYSIDNWVTNISIDSLSGTIDQTEWNKMNDGLIVIKFCSNNTYGTESFAEVPIYKNTAIPMPQDNDLVTYLTIIVIGVVSIVGIVNIGLIFYFKSRTRMKRFNTYNEELQIKVCPFCHKQILIDSNFCVYCGLKLN